MIAIENARLLGEIRQRQAELRVTFDNMADGVGDVRRGRCAWRRGTATSRSCSTYPTSFSPSGPTFDDYIRYLTERGEFGERDPETEIARLRSRIGETTTASSARGRMARSSRSATTRCPMAGSC